jgi:ketosteroid isomerase-like protein
MTRTLDATATVTAERFIEQFRTAWAAPTIDLLLALMHPDITYVQPLLPDVHGREQAGAHWRRIFSLGPDLRVDVVEWAASADNVVYIEVRAHATVGGKALSWPAVERCELDMMEQCGAGYCTGIRCRWFRHCCDREDSLPCCGWRFRSAFGSRAPWFRSTGISADRRAQPTRGDRT